MQDTSNVDPNQIAHAMAIAGPAILIGIIVIVALYLIPIWQIVKKAGFNPALSLLIFVPILNIIMIYVFAFSRWNVVPAPQYGVNYPPPPPGGYPGTGYPIQPAYAQPPAYVPPATAPVYPPVNPNEPPTGL